MLELNNININMNFKQFYLNESSKNVKYFWDDDIKRQTDDAYYVVINNNSFWIPKSVCETRYNSQNKLGYWVQKWWLDHNSNKANMLRISKAVYAGGGNVTVEEIDKLY